MIVDLSLHGKKRFITEQVASISGQEMGYWTVWFSSTRRVFKYNKQRLLYLTNPEIVDMSQKGLYIRKKRIDNAAQVLRFTDNCHTFYRLTYFNGRSEDMDGGDVYITRKPIARTGNNTWDYLREVAQETGLSGENDESILTKAYELVDLERDNVPLAQYLGDKRRLDTHPLPSSVYYPFGCNASQKAAVEAALTHQMSIIQGPPGTGKTQTILNIIANLLLRRQTVLVVSNNNSAVENVAEKLQSEGLGFIVAKLGSAQNKEAFIANQPQRPDMTAWRIKDLSEVKRQARETLENVSKGFNGQLRQAELQGQYNALTTESKYNDMTGKAQKDALWLQDKPSEKLIRLPHLYQMAIENGRTPSLWFRLKWSLALGWKLFPLLNGKTKDMTERIERAYYQSKKTEIEQELQAIEASLKSIDLKQNVKDLRSASSKILKSNIAKRYGLGAKATFSLQDLKQRAEDFLEEYPVVLSTTYSAKHCIGNDMVFDYVIMDEASQVDIKTGALALSCALNAVIVGDDKQLSNVVSKEEAPKLEIISQKYCVSECYNAQKMSFLQSCLAIFKDAPVTLLREHYRCHPKIIGFCNQRFYNGELMMMTQDNGENDVLKVFVTGEGNHAREHFNQREIDVIKEEVMPEYAGKGSIGIITPYRRQAKEINKALNQDIASTVHKYQGRECDTVIMSMVDNEPTDFSDDANLLNVAISRAKTRLCIVTNGNDMKQETNLAQLIAYIKYNNFEIRKSQLRSVFDLLYKQHTLERLKYERTHPAISEYVSENLVYNLLQEAIMKLEMGNCAVLCHYPLTRLIDDLSVLDEEERAFVESPFSHVDFLIYNSLTKQPLKTIEVDGWHFHKQSDVQQHRDMVKDQILEKFNLCPCRLLTTDTVNLETIKTLLLKNN